MLFTPLTVYRLGFLPLLPKYQLTTLVSMTNICKSDYPTFVGLLVLKITVFLNHQKPRKYCTLFIINSMYLSIENLKEEGGFVFGQSIRRCTKK